MGAACARLVNQVPIGSTAAITRIATTGLGSGTCTRLAPRGEVATLRRLAFGIAQTPGGWNDVGPRIIDRVYHAVDGPVVELFPALARGRKRVDVESRSVVLDTGEVLERFDAQIE